MTLLTSLRNLGLAIGASLAVSWHAAAAEHVVRMLNANDSGSMLFEPAFVRAEVGDTVRFEPTNSGHYVRSLALPASARPFSSPEDEPFTLKLDHEGLYFYMCPPHLMMGMVGLIQAGAPVNRQAVAESMLATKGRMMSNSQRVDVLLQQVK
ncbi:plastocyanin/azurin family copper-binding protein [Rhodoferax fermentans]|uniref:Pseudoazurin n=1 Tax=Rhodoferax fermentans TaxID=28066 RepID=A0A1T1ASY2_RHOFE|nr:plastocyanin/azurin family copper-binding protein [Rhodoferax fermentans]MBK1682347.1 pseudoazurin [Rhodoferax fermentans]OOV07210.1 pseudoazurin [Rhodoferax fermentans]